MSREELEKTAYDAYKSGEYEFALTCYNRLAMIFGTYSKARQLKRACYHIFRCEQKLKQERK